MKCGIIYAWCALQQSITSNITFFGNDLLPKLMQILHTPFYNYGTLFNTCHSPKAALLQRKDDVMTTQSKRTPLSDAVALTEILDPKLKTNCIQLQFLQPLSAENASAYALAGNIAVSSNGVFSSNAAMKRKLHLLYGADLSCIITKQGDTQVITFSTSSIADRYALEGEPVFDDLLTIFLDCIRKPNVQNDAFDETEFHIQKKNLLDSIEAEINEKRQYAISQTYKAAFQGEPAAISCFGTKDTASALTPSSVYAAFLNMLKTAKVEAFFVGPEAKPQLAESIRSVFAAIPGRCASDFAFYKPSPIKPQPQTVVEKLPVNQCKMVMGWKTTCDDRYALKTMAILLGGTPSSKLFSNVREKMSLCYYCAANYLEYKHFLMVDCGIETENIDTTKTAILAQLDAICKGEITDEELESTRMCLHNTLHGIGDTASSYINWYFGQMIRDTNLTPEEEEQCYLQVTKEQIVAAAKSMQLDTIYLMQNQEKETETNGNN